MGRNPPRRRNLTSVGLNFNHRAVEHPVSRMIAPAQEQLYPLPFSLARFLSLSHQLLSDLRRSQVLHTVALELYTPHTGNKRSRLDPDSFV